MQKPTLAAFFFTAAAVLLVVIIIIPVVVVKKDKDAGSSSALRGPIGTETPSLASPSGSESYLAVLDFLRATLPEYLQEELEQGDVDSPQLQAAQWLADHDNLTEVLSLDLSDSHQQILQRYSLATFYFALGGDEWDFCGGKVHCNGIRAPWLSAVDECNWAFIRCNDQGLITQINWHAEVWNGEHLIPGFKNNMVGTVPQEVSLLTSLEVFVLTENSVGVDLDRVFQNTTSMVRLWASGNVLDGTFPVQLLQNNPNLREVNLAGNWDLHGPVLGVAGHPSLQELILDDTSVDGTLQDMIMVDNTTSIYQANLRVLRLNNTQVSGTIPSAISQLTKLSVLDLGSTNLDGPLPKELFYLTDLSLLVVGNVGLSGTIPDAVANLTHLSELDLSFNAFEGTVPEEIEALNFTLMDLFLNNNEFTGSVPVAFNFLTALETLTIQNNDLTGSISAAVCAERGLRYQQLATLVVPCQVECKCCDKCE
ncbi:leucine rich repeat [Seminavis robusta]|uniref:Leucine rich repeat n=1 Tax=Seminavis robusta TaxID=568900 RepID=A0A9N8HSD6_9STRA|nr:leucine rich repeat [Seminavis robusta]|eukprot:Sro1372_g267140.1 leucine rich repeat (481) ;mRNA; f:6251-7919